MVTLVIFPLPSIFAMPVAPVPSPVIWTYGAPVYPEPPMEIDETPLPVGAKRFWKMVLLFP